MKRFGPECAIKKQNGRNKGGTVPLAIHSEDQRRAENERRVPKQVAADNTHIHTHTRVRGQKNAPCVSFSYHGGVIVSAHLTVSAIWPVGVEMQSEEHRRASVAGR